MKLEVIVTTLSEAVQAERLGADRLELIADMGNGGTTPSFGTIRNVVEHVSIPVHVMIRPHTKSFHYDEDDVETLLADIGLCRELGVDGIVFGALTIDGRIDERVLAEVIKHKGEMALTFHRAIDASRDLIDTTTLPLIKERLAVDMVHIGNGVRTDGALDESKFKTIRS